MPDSASITFSFKVSGLSSTTWVARFEAVEAMSALFELQLTLTSDDKDLSFSDVVGKTAVLTLEADGYPPRYVHGIVSRFRAAEEGKLRSVYHATVVPALWRLRHRFDARIFQAKAVPDILKAVLQGAGVTSFRLALTGSYSPREYCVQYRESDFAFLSRLMEEEGISYWFEHSEGDHVLVLADAPSASSPIPGPDTLPYKGSVGALASGEGVGRFSYTEEVRTGKVTLTDFNFKKPSLSLLESTAAQLDSDLEAYDFPGEYEVPGDGTAYAKVRLEEHQARRALAEGDTGCARFAPGYLFTLSDHPRDSDNQQYLITALRTRGIQAQMGQGDAGEGPGFANAFQAIPATVPFRPERVTPRPTIKGVQTAIVTGPGGEEIYTDEHGRVKVHFHWDRLGKSDDTSSCWIRVSQIWAGAGWGAMWIPRIGHEVIVDFLEGDPDRPIITGRVYHGTNVPPYPLPAEKTKSTIKSDSSKGGGGNNELRFEDKKGQEEIWLHGQKDWNIKIEHDKNQLVGHDETLVVGHDRKKEIQHDQREDVFHDDTITVGGDRRESIGGNETLLIGSKAQRTVGADQAVGIGANSTINVGANLSESVGGSMHLSVGAGKNENVGADSVASVGANLSTTVGGGHTLSVGKSLNTSVGKDHAETAEDNRTITVGKKLTMTVGESVITVEKDGTITVKGKDITVKGDGTILVQGGSKVTVKSDGPVSVEASGEVKVKGSAVNLN